MVTFEVQSSPDDERLGEITFHFETFTVGGSRKADFFIEDSEIAPIHILLKLNADGLLVNSSSEHFYFSNGKKIKGAKIHKAGDTIKLGSTSLLIKNLEFKNLSVGFEELYKKRLSENPELESLVTQLQKELIYLENNKDV